MAPQPVCEFMKWELVLKPNKTAAITITYGESQPNTNGFKSGKVEKKLIGSVSWQGNYCKIKLDEELELTFYKLDDNVLHLVSGEEFMTGDGGFSFTLNRTEAQTSGTQYKTQQKAMTGGVFDGRTPCHELSAMLKLSPTPDPQCIKRKWRLKLSNTTTQAGTFELNSLKGSWRLQSALLELDVIDHGKLYLLPVGENVLHFLDTRKQLLVGNVDFSYALNRIPGL